MSESTLEAPPVAVESAAAEHTSAPPVPWTLRSFMRRHPWWSVAIGLVILSGILILWARTRPSYDAYGWMVWGYQTLHGSLDLGGAPSWKPMPYLFTVPFALFGHYQQWLWMLTAVSVSLAGAIFGGRIAYRVVLGDIGAADGASPNVNGSGAEAPADVDPGRRRAALLAAVFAGAAVLGIENYMHYILSVQSDPMLVTFVLAAIDMFLLGRYRWTLVLGTLAALGRPEAWAVLGLFMLWAWFKVPSIRWMLIASVAVIGFMWFGIPTITNGRPNISGELAKLSPHALHHNKVIGTIGRFTELQYLPIWIAALGATAFAVLRRHVIVLALAAGTALWVIVEIAFAFHGWPAIARYMFEPAAVAGVLAGVAAGWALLELPRMRGGLPRWAGIPVVAILVIALLPAAVTRLRTEHRDLRHERSRTHEIALLKTTTSSLGGARHITNCGEPVTDVGYVSVMAWLYHRDVGHVGGLQQRIEKVQLRLPIPKVLFKPLVHGGWAVQPWHTLPSKVAACRGLNAAYVVTSSHPGGFLIRR